MSYKDNILHVENVSVASLAEKYGTPLYVYSTAAIRNSFQIIKQSFHDIAHMVCYSVKSNSNIALLGLLKDLGAGADIVSGGELYRALKAGMKPKNIVFSGVGKSKEEIAYALKTGILMFNVESIGELRAINEVAAKQKKRASIAIRVNPDIDADTHHHITTGKAENKFGINFPHVMEAYLAAAHMKHIEIAGIQMHIGSQIKDPMPYIKAVKKIGEIISCLSLVGIKVKFLDIGGGFGIAYMEKEKFFPVRALARELKPLLRGTGMKLIVEPGRFISGPAGILVTRVLYTKYALHKNFVIVDAAMNDLIRPAFYNAYHAISPVVKRRRKSILADIVGPVCESGDFLAKGRHISKLEPGELIAVYDAGAYGFAMSSNYNSRPKAAEVMVSGNYAQIVRERETYKDLIAGERKFAR